MLPVTVLLPLRPERRIEMSPERLWTSMLFVPVSSGSSTSMSPEVVLPLMSDSAPVKRRSKSPETLLKSHCRTFASSSTSPLVLANFRWS